MRYHAVTLHAMRLLLLSNSVDHGRGYLDHAAEEIVSFLGQVERVLFVPFAARDHLAYSHNVRARFLALGIEVERAQPDRASRGAVERAEAVFVGGGNTFRLLDRLQRAGLLDALRRKVLEGTPYIGASAGSVIAAPTLKTTNDMPIVEPASFEALALVPFQINCHYAGPGASSSHMGETREQRIEEFHEENDAPVVGLREGTWLRREAGVLKLRGAPGARLFRRGCSPLELSDGADLSFLLGDPAT